MKKTLITLVIIISNVAYAQNIGINSTGAAPAASAMLDIDASPGNNRGMLIPRLALVTTNNASPVTAPATSLMVYNTATAGSGSTAVVPGYYYWNGSKWVKLTTSAWETNGNAGTIAGTHFIGTTDAQDVVVKTNATEKMRITSVGDVGIGTATPAQKLDVNGVGQFSGATLIGSGILQGFYGDGSNLALRAYNSVSSDICFQTYGGATTNMIIKNNGNVGIGTLPNSSALLDVSSSNKGFLMPRVALTGNTDAVTITSPATGLQVYNTNYSASLSIGVCYYDGAKWLNLSTYLPSGYSYFTQQTPFTVLNNGSLYPIPFGTITAPQSGIYNANLRMFTTSQSGPTISPGFPNETGFYFNVFVNGIAQENVEYYTYNTVHLATSVSLRYSANAGDIITFGYSIGFGYNLDFTNPLFFSRNNVVISKIQ